MGSRGIEFEGETPDPDTFFDVVEHIYPDSGKGVKLSAIGSFPINDRWKISGRLSLFNWSQAYNTNSVSGTGDDEISGTDILLGAEVSYDIRRDVQLYVSYDRFGAEHHDAANIGFGLRYFFGENRMLPNSRVKPKTAHIVSFSEHTHARESTREAVPTEAKITPLLPLPASISIYYPTGKFAFDDANLHKLVKIKTILAVRDDLDISIHGYSSANGDKQRNSKLSIWRAHGVEEQLYLGGIKSSRMEVDFHGDKNQPATAKGQRVDINFTHNGNYQEIETDIVQPLPVTVIPKATIKTKPVLPRNISLYYQLGQFILDDVNIAAVAEIEKVLEARDELDVSIHGYASAIGNEQRNRELSIRRADSVKKQLNEAGISLSRMDVNFHGAKGQPVGPDGQRVEIKFKWNSDQKSRNIATEAVKSDILNDSKTVTNHTEELITDKPVLGTKGIVVEDILLPKLAPVVKVEPKAVVPDNISIYYSADQFTLDGGNLKKLASIKNILDGRDDLEISIHGYASSIGSEKLNRQLSIWRAHGVQNQLYLDGIILSRMHIEFHGDKDQPASTKGQRVEIKFNRNDNNESSETHIEEIKFDIFSEHINTTDIAQVETAINSQDLTQLHHVELISFAKLPGNKQGLIELAAKRAKKLAKLLKDQGVNVPILVNYVLLKPQEKK